ncbi:NAD(P)/FAD-dependent oxidoreductase [Tsukamurella sp. 8F]|uniref:phytoene desaturase family protein n=1 Tax=unclassified Tsukamurella TaxID=2633480 RepID=UPI0023B8895C|nr:MULTISPECIES: NAD(P)/FAD-dependent oxidoreductase [unclassified Tsukamurella]MDF0532028.1 NAD(P)/FAD-dependent oxidoreductase [Tsukamurella sp. 8J]MDF0588433.1 NAD(P)/FAD-dependent oxidoreductase [Tsukamurella sp. 8F]
MTDVDCAVVGSGHNALVGAAYLARAGHSVTVFERDSVPGGAVSTVERFPGYRVDRGSSAHLMIRHTGIVEELQLADHGLTYLDCDPWAFAPPPPEEPHAPPIVFRVDLDATCASIARASGDRDARAYRRFVTDWRPRARAMMSAFGTAATPAGLGRAFWPARGRDTVAGMSRAFLQSGDALLDDYFDDERLKAALAWFGSQSGPAMNEPGTAPMVGFAALMHDLPPGRAIGGSGALTSALLSRLGSDGATVHVGRAVTALALDGDGWRVETAAGPVHARTVLAGCHILTTLDLLEAGGRTSVANWRRRIEVGPGVGMVLRLGTTTMPAFDGVPASDQAGLGLLVSDRGQLARARGEMLAGLTPTRPAVLSMAFSTLDPSIAPPGEHSVTLWSQWYPYRLRTGSWPDTAAAEADRVLAEADRWAPGLSAAVRHRHVQTPDTLESELGLVGGNVMHVEMTLHDMLLFRPLPELAGQRVPGAPGLVLTGASTHPGGGVSGASGRTAARLVARDLQGATGPLTRLVRRRR